jgi:histidinol-phosphate aminotransferase
MNKFNLNSLIRPNVLKLSPYSSARDEFTDLEEDMIFLDANENPFKNGVNRYPDPQQIKIKSILANQNGVKPNNILLGNGSDEVLDLIFRAFCIPGIDNIITLPPTYGMYAVLAGINDVENREVLLSKDFQLNNSNILSSVDSNTKLLFLCVPNNPTGNSFSEKMIVELLENFKGIIIIDEAYIDFSEKQSWVQKLKDYPNLIITKTFSKAFGMAGIRLGICYASQEIISVLNKIKPPYNINTLTQEKVLDKILDLTKIESELHLLSTSKDILYKELVQLNYVEKIYQSDANFILIKVDDATKRYNQLLKKGIVVRNRSKQALCENTLRITIGTNTEINQLIKTLKSLK